MFVFRNSIGIFAIEDGSIKQEFLSGDLDKKEKELLDKGMKKADPREEKKALALISEKKYFDLLREKLIVLTKENISRSVSYDNLIIQGINNIDEMHKITNVLTKRLREWFGYYLPEVVHSIDDNEAFVEIILKNDKDQLHKKYNIIKSMGGEFSKDDFNIMMNVAERIKSLYVLREDIVEYLETIMKKHSPNLLAVAGATIGAKLIDQAGSLERLSAMPSSTVQLLGAEKALFRHLKTGSKPPKYGYIINHQFISKSKSKGKAARMLADKISLAVKIDHFKGEFIGDKIKKELEKKVI